MEPSWFVTPACCGGLFLHPAIVKVTGGMAPIIRSAASKLGEEKRIGFSTWSVVVCMVCSIIPNERTRVYPQKVVRKGWTGCSPQSDRSSRRLVPWFRPLALGDSVPEKGPITFRALLEG